MPEHLEINQYGFTWDQAEVTRLASFRGTHVISVRPAGKTYKDGVEIYVSPTGRSIRVFKDGKELK